VAWVLLELSKVEQRYDAVVAIVRDGLRVTEVAEKFGVHRDTVYVWLARYEEGGLEALADRSHRPRSSPLQMAPEIETQVLELRRLRPGWGPARIAHRLARDGVDPAPSRSGIYRALRRAGLIEGGAASQEAARV
jgi:transposase